MFLWVPPQVVVLGRSSHRAWEPLEFAVPLIR